MASQFAVFNLVISPTPTVAVQADWETFDDSAEAYTDYISASGTVTFQPGVNTIPVEVRLAAAVNSLTPLSFGVKITACRGGTVSTTRPSQEITVSGAPVYPVVPLAGTRGGLVGDSITYANNRYNLPQQVPNPKPNSGGQAAPGAPSFYTRFEVFGRGSTGYFNNAMWLLNNPLELEPALQPNTNPNGSSAMDGYNFAVYGTQVKNWYSDADLTLDPADTGGVPLFNFGPMFQAIGNIGGFDIVMVLGGTNDLSVGTTGSAVLRSIQLVAYDLASRGKTVIVQTITPFTTDHLQADPNDSDAGTGWTLAQMQTIVQYAKDINQGLRDWAATNPPNIFLLDTYDLIVGPNGSDPAGLVSSLTSVTAPATKGNYKPGFPGVQMMYDGLHMGSACGYVVGKAAAALLTQIGVPIADYHKSGPLTIGSDNMVTNDIFHISTTPRAVGGPLKNGRALALGAPLYDSTHPAPSGSLTPDAWANAGLGYTYGQVPDNWFLYRLTNSDQESFSNFNAFTFENYVDVVPAPYLQDSTWLPGALRCQVITDTDGDPAIQLDFDVPVTGCGNEGFLLRYMVAEGQHGIWDNYGSEPGAQNLPQPPVPYNVGDKILADATISFSRMTNTLSSFRVQLGFEQISSAEGALNNFQSTGNRISSIAGLESYFPFNHITDTQMYPEDKVMQYRCPIIPVPAPQWSGQDTNTMTLEFQFAFDCTINPTTCTIVIKKPRVVTVTGPDL